MTAQHAVVNLLRSLQDVGAKMNSGPPIVHVVDVPVDWAIVTCGAVMTSTGRPKKS